MRKKIILSIMVAIGLVSCGEGNKSTPVKVSKELEKSKNAIVAESQIRLEVSDQKNVDTRYVYSDPIGHNLIIENSYPRGGLKYTDPLGKEYIYAVFWTRITNEMNTPFEFKMEFSEDSYDLPSSPDRLFKLFIPSDTLTPEKETLFNYGLDLEKYLNDNFRKQTDLERTINPKDSNGFYVVTLFNKGVNGTLRTGLSIKEEKLIYRINEKTIECGNINLKQLEFKE
ncbi:hypothetical protein [Dokdonia donghaensis]|uniref:Lipoprotein n=1 Tax=Dokdonia donghaensis DSW-1 TaxID=1300343 RepID=A0A0A2GTA5_9FLAO|nr:hypothetical protein [Dokdonia donghaensis]KGO05738.1 hypothetical protein NV36_01995 [Dokdonia donghaensis DSW-1]